MIRDVNTTGSILVCARFHTQLPIVYICSSLKSTTHYHSSSREREREDWRTRVYTPFNLIWAFWCIRKERNKIAAGTSYTYVCASLFSFELFLSALTHVKETSEGKENKHSKLAVRCSTRKRGVRVLDVLAFRNTCWFNYPSLRFVFFLLNSCLYRDNDNLLVDDEDWLFESIHTGQLQRKGSVWD